MKNYRVCVEEVYRGWVWVEAESAEQAHQIAVDQTCSGEINPIEQFDGDTYIDVVDEEENQNA
jgi:hypothetical protein